ncbi:dTDP-4-amino-4,6-dideoxygalactose transaminase [Vibrio genomosp. F10]|uniref:dTDP-4-amino-4,6-dideoxygalactose transaminase n=1 Tax=Vibrio genomosp. F10 TaxID=723171 RepID=UPI000306CD48|nr:dTDP-4-amino-4,6-dideoxygalactose transaminase [Vibrio genomosp. F10]OEF06211.1 dTDP-4-amino-4,6-dideoxygalactose transaminase [Vibrio genomosp. F10 str. 9ZB36]
MILFNKPTIVGNENEYISQAILSEKLSGDGPFTKKCQMWFEEHLGCCRTLLTPSCTAALEMAAILFDVQPDDEVIMPSYTFVSTANAFVLRGAKIVFVDIRPDTMNIDETLIEAAITPKTKVIVPVHYAGVACEMDIIMDIASRYSLYVVEDAAQGMMAEYKGRPLGTIGHLGAYSFHATKNYTSGGEGGLLIVNDESFLERAEIIREKGTDRSQFIRGEVGKYTWVDIGSSFLMSDLSAAFLYTQLEVASNINDDRNDSWRTYYKGLSRLEGSGHITLPKIPCECTNNAHMFYIKVNNVEIRKKLIKYLSEYDIYSAFHYIPLHTSPSGREFGIFNGSDKYTTIDSARLLRLPLYFGIEDKHIKNVVDKIVTFFDME